MPDPAKSTYTGLNDAAGTPFYFNGLPKLIYNPAAFGPAGGKTVTTGVPVSSGVLSPAGPKAPPAKVTYTFPKAGVFQLICNVHPGMKICSGGETGRHAAPAQRLAGDREGPDGHRSRVGEGEAAGGCAGAEEHGVRGRRQHDHDPRLLPAVLTVKAGTTVTFVNQSPSEVHNVAFGPTKYLLQFSKQTDFLPAGPGSTNQVTPVYPVRLGAEGQLHVRRHEPRQRVLRRRRSRRARRSCRCRGRRR